MGALSFHGGGWFRPGQSKVLWTVILVAMMLSGPNRCQAAEADPPSTSTTTEDTAAAVPPPGGSVVAPPAGSVGGQVAAARETAVGDNPSCFVGKPDPNTPDERGVVCGKGGKEYYDKNNVTCLYFHSARIYRKNATRKDIYENWRCLLTKGKDCLRDLLVMHNLAYSKGQTKCVEGTYAEKTMGCYDTCVSEGLEAGKACLLGIENVRSQPDRPGSFGPGSFGPGRSGPDDKDEVGDEYGLMGWTTYAKVKLCVCLGNDCNKKITTAAQAVSGGSILDSFGFGSLITTSMIVVITSFIVHFQ